MSELARITLLPLLVAAVAVALAAPLEGQSWRTLTAARQHQGERELRVKVEYGAGTLELSPAERSRLYDFEVRYDEEQFVPLAEYRRESGTLRLGATGREGRRGTTSRGAGSEARASVRLSPDVPTALQLKFGAGEARLDLGGMALRSLDLSTGASETAVRFDAPNRVPAEHVRMQAGAASLRVQGLGNTGAQRFEFDGGVGETVLDFGGAWRRSATASVKMGIGSLTLRFPRDLGVQIVRSSFLTSFSGEGLVRRGGGYYSANWDDAEHRLTVHVSAALGSIDVQWID